MCRLQECWRDLFWNEILCGILSHNRNQKQNHKKISNPLKLNDVQIDKVDCGKGRRETAHRLHHSDRFPKNVGKSLRNEKESRRLVRIFDSIFQFKTMIAMVIEIEKKSSNWKTFGIYFIVNKMYFFDQFALVGGFDHSRL